MGRSPDSFEPEVLLAEAGWMRRLARRLLDDPAGAEDVVQEAWVAALERRPRPDEDGTLRSWLGRVVRNQAARRRRRETMRPEVERRAARGEAVAGDQEAVERLACVQQVSAALLAIAEPYRSAVTLRHMQGLGAREIAARQGCRVDAARQRVARGLALLRAELDRRSNGNRSAWSLGLASAWGLAREGAPSSLPAMTAGAVGGVLVSAKALSFVVLVGIAAGLLVWLRPDPVVGRSSVEIATPAAPLERPEAPPSFSAVADGLAVPGAAPKRKGATATAAAARATSVRWSGRVVDDLGQPLEGARLSLASAPDAHAALDPEDDQTQELEVTSADAGGVFELAPEARVQARSGELWVRAALADHVEMAQAVEPKGVEELELVLVRRPVVRGRLLTPEGDPATGPGQVELTWVDADGGPRQEDLPVDERGEFRSGGLEPGQLIRISGRAKGYASGERSEDLALTPGSRHELELSLVHGARIVGRVVDADGGRPVPFAEVWADAWSYDEQGREPTAHGDGEGRFVLEGVEPRPVGGDWGDEIVWVQVTARAEGYVGEAFNHELARRNDDGDYEIDVKVRAALGTFRGRAIRRGGEPADGMFVYAFDCQRNVHTAGTDGAGRFELSGLPAGKLELMVWKGLDEPLEERGAGRLSIEITLGASVEADIVVAPPGLGLLAGRVRDTWGEPVEGATVEVLQLFETESFAMSSGATTLTTDELGRFELRGAPPSTYRVAVVSEEWVGRDSRQIGLQRDARHTDLEFEVGEPIELAGWVDAGDHDPRVLSLALRSIPSDEHVQSLALDARGRFRARGLFPGSYALVIELERRELGRLTTPPGGGEGLVVVAGP